MINAISTFMDSIKKDPNHRFRSWEHCYNAFGIMDQKKELDDETIDFLSLHLSFYLASWGMYRGSSGLLWKDYRTHTSIVKILFTYRDLRDDSNINEHYLRRARAAYDELTEIYGKIKYFDQKNENEKTITPTITLISKILLGTLGCIPAIDRYFKDGYKIKHEVNIDYTNLWPEIGVSSNEQSTEITECQRWIAKHCPGIYYPKMKILDMYYWEIGYAISQ